MARAWRENFAIPVVAVTGSSGKTTVKSLIGAILGVRRNVCVTEGSLNNDIGVPLTLMRLTPSTRVLVARSARTMPARSTISRGWSSRPSAC
jgi:UDP-N-acetylmuramoyl-tripeptide--D-alanyl-D-alanine ligase